MRRGMISPKAAAPVSRFVFGTEPPKWTPKTIRALRQKLGLSQELFAGRLGVTFSTVSRWEHGKVPGGLSRQALDRLFRDWRRPIHQSTD